LLIVEKALVILSYTCSNLRHSCISKSFILLVVCLSSVLKGLLVCICRISCGVCYVHVLDERKITLHITLYFNMYVCVLCACYRNSIEFFGEPQSRPSVSTRCDDAKRVIFTTCSQ